MHPHIPPHAEKVFSGVRMDIYQWDQELYDGSMTRFERVRFRDGAFVIWVLGDGRILMTEQWQPARHDVFFSLPGGWFDTVDEDPLECAQRELYEETGYESDDYELWVVAEWSVNLIGYTYFYIARNCVIRRPHHNPDAGEKIRVFTTDIDEFLSLALDPRFTHSMLIPHMLMSRYESEKYREFQRRISPDNMPK